MMINDKEHDNSDEEVELSENDNESDDSINDFAEESPEDEDSDSSPEEVGFKAEKERSNLNRKRTLEGINAQKQQIKKKRAEIHARNLIQKEGKKLKSKALPEEILSHLSSSSELNLPTEIPDVEKSKETRVIKSKPEFTSKHGSTTFTVKNLNEQKRLPIPEEALNFRNHALRRNLREKSTKDFCMKRVKQKAGRK